MNADLPAEDIKDKIEQFLYDLPPIPDEESEEIITEYASISALLLDDASDDTYQERASLVTNVFDTVQQLADQYEDGMGADSEAVRDTKADARAGVRRMADRLPEEHGVSQNR